MSVPRKPGASSGFPASPASAASPAKSRKSPLRVAALPAGFSPPLPSSTSVSGSMTNEQLRAMMISEFCQWLRSRTNQEKRPFQEETITAYKTAARALDAWMTASGLEGDFTGCDTGVLNRFFRDYHAAHGQGGTNTKQRNLRHLFTWLEAQYDHPHPYTDELNRYAPVKTRPSTLSVDFIKDLLAVTGAGKGKSFADIRDHALIRVLAEGLRRTEVVQMQMDDLPADLVLQRLSNGSGEGDLMRLAISPYGGSQQTALGASLIWLGNPPCHPSSAYHPVNTLGTLPPESHQQGKTTCNPMAS
jgi:hypothetical protein